MVSSKNHFQAHHHPGSSLQIHFIRWNLRTDLKAQSGYQDVQILFSVPLNDRLQLLTKLTLVIFLSITDGRVALENIHRNATLLGLEEHIGNPGPMRV